MVSIEKNKQKNLGQVFTPDYVIDIILDDVGYIHNNILGKTIIEPSFGNGAFLIQIIRRFISECQSYGFTNNQICKELENSIYGIEIDDDCYSNAIKRINAFVNTFGIENVNWHLYNQDALLYEKYDTFDFVVGNPPYVRIHHMKQDVRDILKGWNFATGITDMYIAFFELGIKLLNTNGKLGFITPNSYITNTSQGKFRKYLLANNLLSKIENFGSSKVFDNVAAYTAITILDKAKQTTGFTYTRLNGADREFCTAYSNDDFMLDEEYSSAPFVLTNENDKQFLESIEQKGLTVSDIGSVQYGFSTNRDYVYIAKNIENKGEYVIFNGYEIEKQMVKKIVKGSKYHGEGTYFIVFPYECSEHNRPHIIDEGVLKTYFPKCYAYFMVHKSELMKRDMDANATIWYQFARSQGINNCCKRKLVINQIIRPDSEHVEVYELAADVYVYSGIYITALRDEDLGYIRKELESELFYRYAYLKGKDMSGGYKSINSNIVKNYRIDRNKYLSYERGELELENVK